MANPYPTGAKCEIYGANGEFYIRRIDKVPPTRSVRE
jgi:hypothetical protein